MSNRVKNILYITIAAILLVWLLGYEFFWRYETGFEMTRKIAMQSHSGAQKFVVVHQTSFNTVDTIRRVFADMNNAKVTCEIWLEGTTDTIHTEATGRYFSELRPTHISNDRSTQVVLIPNSEHELPTGWGELLYLNYNDSLCMQQIINANIADIDKDSVLEMFDKTRSSWTKLDPATGGWALYTIKRQ